MKFNELDSYKELKKHFEEIRDVEMMDLFNEDSKRGEKYFIELINSFVNTNTDINLSATTNLKLDYSKNKINNKTLSLLIELARESNLDEAIKDMFSGKKINNTENREVLHTALRSPSYSKMTSSDPSKDIFLESKNIRDDIQNVLDRMNIFADSIRKDKNFTDIVVIGIGGSNLGPLMMCEALKYYEEYQCDQNCDEEITVSSSQLKMHFISNVDDLNIKYILKSLNPQSTLFIISSKTFTTQETIMNANYVKTWFQKSANYEASCNLDITKNFVAVTANKQAALDFGIKEEYIFEFWNWVGGRYSLWSSVGLPIMIYLGSSVFYDILIGAYIMDQHFLNTPFEQNMPVILGVLGIWYINFFNISSHVIAPYDACLKYLPQFIAQLDMESNGKEVTKDGQRISYKTGPTIFGGSAIDAQHAFFQSLHQGTHAIPIDLIISLRKNDNLNHHKFLASNAIAQAEAFMKGKNYDEVYNEMKEKDFSEDEIKRLAPHKVLRGNKPSNFILLNKISPQNLGSLIALYEHKIFVQGVIWGINSFDQFGVELGKQFAKTIFEELKNGLKEEHDSSTSNLIKNY